MLQLLLKELGTCHLPDGGNRPFLDGKRPIPEWTDMLPHDQDSWGGE